MALKRHLRYTDLVLITLLGEGVIFCDLWPNWTHFGSLLEENSLTEENPDFFKQIFRGCFGLHSASEAQSDLTIGYLMASKPSILCSFQVFFWLFWPSF